MGEIDDLHDPQDEGETDPDQRIGASDDQPIDQILKQHGHEKRFRRKKGPRAPGLGCDPRPEIPRATGWTLPLISCKPGWRVFRF